jgi:opacity protein-like surface antigen
MMNSVLRTFQIASLMLLIITASAARSYAQGTRADAPAGASDAPAGPSESYALEKGMNEFGVWGGGSFDSPTLIGTAEERKFFTLGLRYGRIFATSKHVAFEYTVDAVPVAVVFQPDFAQAFNRHHDKSVYGAGLSPIGFKFNFNRQGRVQPFAHATGGFLYFKQPVPADVAGATRFNFTFDFGGGVQIATRSHRAVMLGYKFQHISNANRSNVNPGLDANVIYVGYSIFK